MQPSSELLVPISFGVTCADPLEVVFVPKCVIFPRSFSLALLKSLNRFAVNIFHED